MRTSLPAAWFRPANTRRFVHSAPTRRSIAAMTNDRVFERHFIAFGVGIRLRTDSLSLVATLLPERLPVGWRPVEIHEREPPESLQYEVLTESGQVPYRLYAGTYLLAEATNTTDLVSALASHSERFVSEH